MPAKGISQEEDENVMDATLEVKSQRLLVSMLSLLRKSKNEREGAQEATRGSGSREAESNQARAGYKMFDEVLHRIATLECTSWREILAKPRRRTTQQNFEQRARQQHL